jgi:hypothetical protein
MRDLCRSVVVASFVAIIATSLLAQSASSAEQVPPTAVQTALSNADVARLVAMRVSDATVIAVINEAAIRAFDLSASGS